MDEVVKGQVAEIISDRELILNRGASHGVREGMYFKILDPKGFKVEDPETGEYLGGLKRVKVVVVATQVADKITLATTFRTKTINVGGENRTGLESIAKTLAAPKYVERVERLRIDPNAARPITPEESIVSKGDPFESTNRAGAEAAETVAVWE
ncbi:hypothetical protein [Pseudarthrobacter sp. GA104]|uniref:hypothetical protein n=1 Tax=Pseudarthrobacter sp. GA104 TaxID=2676311 RepID=UPI0012F82712|nr:hypothetical protein [Pseudarthrobacter sp. GA104]MUU69735.1 hypothetical protein [Pseudarthrobacter sp. GA104]